MSREIKFRAWYMPFGSNGQMQEMMYKPAGSILSFAEMSPDKYIVEQFTGLKDKNGEEIYEGDIVEIKNHPFQKKPDTLTGIQIDGKRTIEWSDAGCWCAGTLLLAKLMPWIKVIGNIHEDGQLLEADK